jgi:hypothetical protein
MWGMTQFVTQLGITVTKEIMFYIARLMMAVIGGERDLDVASSFTPLTCSGPNFAVMSNCCNCLYCQDGPHAEW